MKKQAGLKVSNDGNQVKPYNTIVFDADIPSNTLKLAHGGWVTQSTAKAINRALAAHGVPGGVFRRAGTMYYKGPNGHVTEVGESLTKVRVV